VLCVTTAADSGDPRPATHTATVQTLLRRFMDSKGREWEVWEVGVRELPADILARHHEVSGLPERWLCFESATDRRRLVTYPPRWHAMHARELEALCQAAVSRKLMAFPAAAVTAPADGDRLVGDPGAA